VTGCHEMAHLAFAELTSDDSWAEEGLATYVEPLARVRAGTLSEDEVWACLMEGIPKGQPRRAARGLHGTQDWGRARASFFLDLIGPGRGQWRRKA
jgi:hypothetical protein